MQELNGKVAVITGAGSGIGKSLAKRAGLEGMKVVLAGRRKENLSEVEQELKATGTMTLCVQTDVSNKEDVETLARKSVDTFGAVHLLINNAGITGGSIGESTVSDWQWIMGINLWSVIYGVHSFLPLMEAQKDESRIVNVASIAGIVASADLGIYCVTKYGVVALSEALHYELAERKSKVGISVVCPSYVRTPIIDTGRNRPPQDGTDQPDRPSQLQMDATWDSLGVKTNSNVWLPDDVADYVFDAIHEDKLYIITHPESKDWIRTRMENLLNERNPVPG
jgi:NAD(P)-dependent dehydrogenase (short-subunit alcohol dehydrogenase family)